MKKIAFFVSGAAHLMRRCVSEMLAGKLNANPLFVLTSDPEAECRDFLFKSNVPLIVESRNQKTIDEYGEILLGHVDNFAPDLIILTFSHLLSPTFLNQFTGRCINIHPSLLPSFKGLRAREEALSTGVCFMGGSLHFVEANVDEGPIISQFVLPVGPFSTIESISAHYFRLLQITTLNTLKFYCEDRIFIREGKTFVKDACYNGSAINPVVEYDLPGDLIQL